MKLGLQLNSFDWGGGTERFGRNLADIGRTAEEAGFDRIGVADHLWQHPIMGGPEADEPECYMTLAFLAANTERIGLTAMVSGIHFRHPAVLVKSVTTLDVLSGGRAGFGVGSGHYEEEATWARHPFPSAERAFRDARGDASRSPWGCGAANRETGIPSREKHYRLGRALNLPQSTSRPHPAIMIAGDGEKKTLRLVARYADACSLRPGPQVPGKLDVLRRHCEEEGRDYDDDREDLCIRFRRRRERREGGRVDRAVALALWDGDRDGDRLRAWRR